MSDLEILELAHNWCHENFSSFGVPKLHSGALTSSLVELIKKTHTPASPVAPAPPTGNNSRYAGLEDDAKWIRESATHSEIVNILKHRVDLFARVTELEAALAPVAMGEAAQDDYLEQEFKRGDEVWIRGKVMDAYDNNPIYVAPYCVSNSTGTVGVNLEDIRHALAAQPAGTLAGEREPKISSKEDTK